MTVEDKLAAIAAKIPGCTYMFGHWAQINAMLKKGHLPAILNILPISGAFDLGKTQLRDYPNVLLAFVDKTEYDFDAKENDAIIEECKNRAKLFILEFNKSGLFKPIDGEIPYSLSYDRLDVNVTGITLDFRPEERNGIVLCPTKTPESLVYGERCTNNCKG